MIKTGSIHRSILSGQEVKIKKIFLKGNKPWVKFYYREEVEPDSHSDPVEMDRAGDNYLEISMDNFEKEYRKI